MKLANKQVLVVDDFQNMRSTLRQMLFTLGFDRITLVATGEEALAALRVRPYDIILCDYNLGDGIDGQQLLDQARSEGLIHLGTVFIMVTAEKSTEMVLGALESAPDAYLSKPFTKDLLSARLRRALARREPLLPVAHKFTTKGVGSALRELEALLLRAPANRRLELLRLRAELAFTLGDLAKCETTCQEAMADKPLAWAQTQLGQIAEQRGNLAAAEVWYRKSMTLTPYFMAAHDRLVELYERLGRASEGLEILLRAIERSPKSLARQRHLGRLAARLKRYDLAEPAWRRAIAMARQMGLPEAADYLGLIRTLAGRGEAREAQQVLRTLNQQCRRDAYLAYWTLAAKFYCLDEQDENARTALWGELDSLLQAQLPEGAPGAALAAAVSARGDPSSHPALARFYHEQTHG